MRKRYFLILVLFCIFLLTGCGSKKVIIKIDGNNVSINELKKASGNSLTFEKEFHGKNIEYIGYVESLHISEFDGISSPVTFESNYGHCGVSFSNQNLVYFEDGFVLALKENDQLENINIGDKVKVVSKLESCSIYDDNLNCNMISAELPSEYENKVYNAFQNAAGMPSVCDKFSNAVNNLYDDKSLITVVK